MPWIRSRLALAATVVMCTHVAAIGASAVVLCCLPHLGSAGETESCPLHRSGDETCSMSECPMHGDGAMQARAVLTHTHADHATPPGDEPGATSTGDDCQLVCNDDDLSPAIMLGPPGLLPVTGALPSPDLIAERLTSTVLSLPDQIAPVSIPPPRS